MGTWRLVMSWFWYAPRKIIFLVYVIVCCLLILYLFKSISIFPVLQFDFKFTDRVSNEAKCSLEVISRQETNFLSLMNQNAYWSGCYGDDYLLQMYLADQENPSHSEHKLMIDVGANKDYVIASLMSLWAPENGVNPSRLGHFLPKLLGHPHCGVCNDCAEAIHVKTSNITRKKKYLLEIHAFEPQPSMFKVLKGVKSWTNLSTLFIHNIAMSNHTGNAVFQKCNAGDEACGLTDLSSDNNTNYTEVNVTTLDSFIRKHHITNVIDLLKVDTEGYCALVLQGAEKILSTRQVRLVIFEHHHVGPWSHISLLNIIENLETKGYTCYMLGRTGIFRMTQCWSTHFATKRWSNVLCIDRRQKHLRNFIERLLIR